MTFSVLRGAIAPITPPLDPPLVPRLHLANNDSAICFKAAFPTSELKVVKPTYFWKLVRLIKPLLKICHKSFASHPLLIIMCHFKAFLLQSNAKQETYMKHTLTSKLSTLSKIIGGIEKLVPQKKIQKLNFSSSKLRSFAWQAIRHIHIFRPTALETKSLHNHVTYQSKTNLFFCSIQKLKCHITNHFPFLQRPKS